MPQKSNPKSEIVILNSQKIIQNPKLITQNPIKVTLYSKIITRNPKKLTHNPKPEKSSTSSKHIILHKNISLTRFVLTITIKYCQSSITFYKIIEWQNKHHFQCSKFNFLHLIPNSIYFKQNLGSLTPPFQCPPQKNISPPTPYTSLLFFFGDKWHPYLS